MMLKISIPNTLSSSCLLAYDQENTKVKVSLLLFQTSQFHVSEYISSKTVQQVIEQS